MKVNIIKVKWEPFPPYATTDEFDVYGQLFLEDQQVATLPPIHVMLGMNVEGYAPEVVMYELAGIEADRLHLEVNNLNDEHTIVVNDTAFVTNFGDYNRPTRGTFEPYDFSLPLTPGSSILPWVIGAGVLAAAIMVVKKSR